MHQTGTNKRPYVQNTTCRTVRKYGAGIEDLSIYLSIYAICFSKTKFAEHNVGDSTFAYNATDETLR